VRHFRRPILVLLVIALLAISLFPPMDQVTLRTFKDFYGSDTYIVNREPMGRSFALSPNIYSSTSGRATTKLCLAEGRLICELSFIATLLVFSLVGFGVRS
jgi:hypothetical protein